MTIYFTLIDIDSNIEVESIKAINYHPSKELVYKDILHEKAKDAYIYSYCIVISDNSGILNKHFYGV